METGNTTSTLSKGIIKSESFVEQPTTPNHPHIILFSSTTSTMTVFAETFSLSALLRSKSIDIKQIDLIDDNARLPSEELIGRVGLEYSISSIVTVDEDESICSMNDPFTASTEFDLPACDLDVAGDARWGETKKEQESVGCGPTSRSVPSVSRRVSGRGSPPKLAYKSRRSTDRGLQQAQCQNMSLVF
jgi:hypothetical protein